MIKLNGLPRRAVLVIALIISTYFLPLSAAGADQHVAAEQPSAGDNVSVFMMRLTEYGSPFIPSMSSFQLSFPTRLFLNRIEDALLQIKYWYLSATYYFHFDPFVEMGLQLSYIDYKRHNSYWSVSVGAAAEYFDLAISIPFVAGASWLRALGKSNLWAGVDFQALVRPDGVGVEVGFPLEYYSRARVYAAIMPQVITYFVDNLIHFNVRTAVTIGLRGRDRT